MNKRDKTIRLGHGSGGRMTHDLIRDIFLNHFDNSILHQQGDSAIWNLAASPDASGHSPARGTKLAFSTDSYVVDPIFFPGGNIGSLAVSGTVNDLAVSGARPLFLSAAFIIEEGFPLDQLDEIARAMAAASREADVPIVAGDTKVVHKGKCDKVFITTSGVGLLDEALSHIPAGSRVTEGDVILVNGYAGDHGIAILGERESLKFQSPILSDAACLNGLIAEITDRHEVHFMRDATRGGVATVLSELAGLTKHAITIEEQAIPVREEVRGICEIFGYDPLYMANEGKVVLVVPGDQANMVLERMKTHPLGRDASIIGKVGGEYPGKVVLHTEIGGKRFLDMLAGEMLPRIC